jgi:predicted glycoside hydrolase/deacetylase ChbG (UPF0249 family)
VKRVIVNADDLGGSEAANQAVAECHEKGIVTSASLLVGGAAARAVPALAKEHPNLGIGLHLDLSDGAPGAVLAAARSQLRRFRELLGRDPTHLDSHAHAHGRWPAALEALVTLAWETGRPVRADSPAVAERLRGEGIRTTDTCVAGFPGGAAAPEEDLVRVLEETVDGTTEVVCHPVAAPERGALTGHAARQTLQASGVRLIHFGQL